MIYKVRLKKTALKEWEKIGRTIQDQFKKKLKAIQENPRIPKARLRNGNDHYKIKLRGVGYRLVYQVIDGEIVIEVIAVGRRDDDEFYEKALNQH